MKTVLILSDTHGNAKGVADIADIIRESDYVFHLGDGYNDLNALYPEIKDKLYRVHGNCDFGSNKEAIVEIEERRIFATHGDLYGVKRGTERLINKAKSENCDICLYGHTHRPEIREEDGILVINPGTFQRYTAYPTFCYLVINGKKTTAVINDKRR